MTYDIRKPWRAFGQAITMPPRGTMVSVLTDDDMPVALVYGATPEEAEARARRFAAAAIAVDVCTTYRVAMEHPDGPTDDQWQYIDEHVEAVVKAVGGGC